MFVVVMFWTTKGIDMTSFDLYIQISFFGVSHFGHTLCIVVRYVECVYTKTFFLHEPKFSTSQ